MNIVFTINDNYAIHCATLIESIFLSRKTSSPINSHIISNDLSHEKKMKLSKSVVNHDKCILKFYNYEFDNSFVLSNSPSLPHISAETFVRLFITKILPSNLDRVLYLDVDIIINGDLTELFNKVNLENYLIAAVPQIDEFFLQNNQRVYNSNYLYFNAGVVLFNLNQLRKIDIINVYKNFYSKHSNLILYNDQDILNYCLGDKVYYLDLKYNVITPLLRNSSFEHTESFVSNKFIKYNAKKKHREALITPIITHFVSRPKPWEIGCPHPFKNLYIRCLRLTDFNFTYSNRDYIFSFILIKLKFIFNLIFNKKNNFIRNYK